MKNIRNGFIYKLIFLFVLLNIITFLYVRCAYDYICDDEDVGNGMHFDFVVRLAKKLYKSKLQLCLNHEQRDIVEKVYGNKGFSLKDILIVIKSTEAHYTSRLNAIIRTWYQLARTQTYVVSDSYSPQLDEQFDGKLISTYCHKDHSRFGLCCKFGHELNLFFHLNRDFKWFCHVDDDNYINIPNLVKFLSEYDPDEYWYIGRASWNVPTERTEPKKYLSKPVRFWFGTLGAGVCLSKATMNRIYIHSSAYHFTDGCNKMELPDDMYLGYLLEVLNNINLTNTKAFNHHLDESQFQDLRKLDQQITLSFGNSYRQYFDKRCNCTKYYEVLPNIATTFNNDQFRVKSLHCLLFPKTTYCKSMFTHTLIKLNILQN